MATETEFLNGALGRFGAASISAITDGSTNANWCQIFWPPLRRSLLRSHHWNFAEGRAELAQEATPPLFEFAFSYQLPADLLKLKEYNGATTNIIVDSELFLMTTLWYKIEGRKILTNDGVVKIVYVKDVTDPNLWDGLFYQAAMAWLASDLAGAIAKDDKKSASLKGEAVNILLPVAMAIDGQENPVAPFVVDNLLWGR